MSRSAISIPFGWALASSATLLAMGYAIATKPIEDFVNIPFTIALILILPLSVAAVSLRLANPEASADHRLILYFIGATILYSTITFCTRELGADAFFWLENPDLKKPIAAVYISSFAALFGGLLFLVRLKLRFIYGASEAIVGLVVSTHKVVTEINQVAAINTNTTLAFLTAGIYLIVRGLDNMHQGLSKEPFDGLVLLLISRLPWTESGMVRSEFTALKRSMKAPDFIQGRIFSRPCMYYKDQKSSNYEYDFLNRKVKKFKRIACVALDDDRLVFRLTNSSSRLRALSLPGATEWDPTGVGRQLHEWIALPISGRDEFLSFSKLALEDAKNDA